MVDPDNHDNPHRAPRPPQETETSRFVWVKSEEPVFQPRTLSAGPSGSQSSTNSRPPSRVGESDLYVVAEVGKYLWFCCDSIRDEPEASFIIRVEFVKIVVPLLRVANQDMNERSCQLVGAEIFTKVIPKYLLSAQRMDFTMFTEALYLIASKYAPEPFQHAAEAKAIWLAMAANRCTMRLTDAPEPTDSVFVFHKMVEWSAKHRSGNEQAFGDAGQDVTLYFDDLEHVSVVTYHYRFVPFSDIVPDPNFCNHVLDPLFGPEPGAWVEKPKTPPTPPPPPEPKVVLPQLPKKTRWPLVKPPAMSRGHVWVCAFTGQLAIKKTQERRDPSPVSYPRSRSPGLSTPASRETRLPARTPSGSRLGTSTTGRTMSWQSRSKGPAMDHIIEPRAPRKPLEARLEAGRREVDAWEGFEGWNSPIQMATRKEIASPVLSRAGSAAAHQKTVLSVPEVLEIKDGHSTEPPCEPSVDEMVVFGQSTGREPELSRTPSGNLQRGDDAPHSTISDIGVGVTDGRNVPITYDLDSNDFDGMHHVTAQRSRSSFWGPKTLLRPTRIRFVGPFLEGQEPNDLISTVNGSLGGRETRRLMQGQEPRSVLGGHLQRENFDSQIQRPYMDRGKVSGASKRRGSDGGRDGAGEHLITRSRGFSPWTLQRGQD